MTALLIMIAGLSSFAIVYCVLAIIWTYHHAGASSGFSTTFSSGTSLAATLGKDLSSISAGSAEGRSGSEAMAGG